MLPSSPNLLQTSPLVVWPVHCRCLLFTLWTLPEPDSPTITKVPTENDNSTVSSMSTKRLSLPMVFKVFTEDSSSPASESSSTEDSTSDFTTLSDHWSSEKKVMPVPVSSWDGLSPLSVDWLLTQLIPSEGV